MKKVYTLFIITLLACINIVLVGYSTFYFNIEASKSPKVDIAVNNIKQNYGRNEHGEDYYDVYFFPQPRYAYGNNITYDKSKKDYVFFNPWENTMNYDLTNHYENGRKTSGYGGLIDGYWSSSVLNLEKEFDKIHYEYIDGIKVEIPGPEGAVDTVGLYKATIDKYKPILQRRDIIESMSYRKISNVYKRLTIQQLEDIGNPKTAMLDSSNWIYQFTGWTANKISAQRNGYGGMTDFNFVDSMIPLSTIDSMDANGNLLSADQVKDAYEKQQLGVDGSLIGDGTVFLYPIYAIGKDYSLIPNPSAQPSSLDLNKGSGYDKTHKFLPIVDREKGLYAVKNIYLSEEEEKNGVTYSYNADIPLMYKGWGGVGDKINEFNTIQTTPSGDEIEYKFKDFPVISEAGYYNVYTYVKIFDVGTKRGSGLGDKIIKNLGYVDGKNAENEINNPKYQIDEIIDNTSNLVNIAYTSGTIEYEESHEVSLWIEKTYDHIAKVAIWTYVERVYEYKITGGPADTFNFYSLSSPLIFKTGTDYIDGKYTENYIANNIYFNSDDITFKYKYDTVDEFGNPIIVTNVFRETVFTVAADSSGVGYNLEIDSNPPEGYIGTLSDPNQQILRIPRVGKTINDSSDYTYTKDPNYLNGRALKVNEAGYFDFNLKVIYNAQRDGIEKILVSARKVSSILAFVKLVNYVDNGSEFNRVQPLTGSFIDIAGKEFTSSESGPFDKIVNNYYNNIVSPTEQYYYTSLEIPINTHYSGLKSMTFQCIDSATGLHVSSKDKTLQQLIDEGYQLIDHTTGLPVDIDSNNVIRLSHIFYLKRVN